MFAYTFWGSAIFAMLAIGASQVAAAIDNAYAARYKRELYLTAKEKRELAKAGRKLAKFSQDHLEKMKNPEWEPVEDEADKNPSPIEEEGGD